MASTALDREAIDEAVARGSDLLKQGKLDDAQKAFRAALMIDNENARVLALLGLTHFRAGQFTQARPIYEELVERAPTDASHRLNLGLVYLKLGDSDKAIGSLEASRALDPSQGRAVSYLGLAYARAGRYAEAYRSFLLAGQNDLATEIETNLTPAERESIQAQLRGGDTRKTPPPPPRTSEVREVEVPAPPADAPQVSMPEIVVDRPELQQQVREAEEADRAFSEAAHDAAANDAAGANDAAAPVAVVESPRMTDSLQFVLPERDAVPAPADGQSMISRAVEVVTPTTAVATGARSASNATPPIPLSQLATEHLVRPDGSTDPFEVSSDGALVIRVAERVLTRLDGVHVTGGELEYEPATRRSRGTQTDEKFDFGGSRLHSVSGSGYLIAIPGSQHFTAVALDDDIFYLREDLVFAFEATLRWENGNVPGLRGKLPVVQFRGDGAVALRTKQPLVRVKLPAQGVVYVDATRLAGWIGRVVPRAVVPPSNGPMGEVCVECTGEGVVLVDPSGPLPPGADGGRARTPSTAGTVVKPTPPPPPQPSASGEHMAADWLGDDAAEKA